MKNFAPGPWTADDDGFIRAAKGKTNVAIDTGMALGTNVANVTGNHAPKHFKPCKRLPIEPQISANARLIASAPDLLAALESLFALGRGEIERPLTRRAGWAKFEAQARAAILKATQP